ncbi:MAG: iron-containing alcohol dehydrogenase family protein [Firmicutes bacterium]|nr:iron-containing alcohol dehydrogenase family protein [Bacillota bacterium]
MKSKFHRISIPSIVESGPNSLDKLGYLLNRESLNNIVVFFDEHMKELLGERIDKILNEANINFKSKIINTINYCSITHEAFSISNDVDAILAVGGGKVLDVSKYMSFLRRMPFISIPTSTSNDGFGSPVASLFLDGKRTTVPAKVPYGIIVDTTIIASAPDYFVYSGIGDLISNITALWDWQYEEKNKTTTVDDFAVMISRKAVESFLSLPFYSIKEPNFIHNLVDSLIMNGIAMEISGTSAPSSGSEHLISHALDKIVEKPQLHGIQVGISTYIMSRLQENKVQEIINILKATGFWEYAETLNLKAKDFKKAIDIAPTIKPQRRTIIHDEKKRNMAKEIIEEDVLLKGMLK